MDTARATILASRCIPPQTAFNAVLRKTLIDGIDDGQESVLALSAPAGYGKTTVLAQWCQNCQKPYAWVSIESHAADSGRFWAYVVYAIGKAFPSLPIAPISQALSKRGFRAIMPQLVTMLASQEAATTFVFDDTQNIENDEIWEELGMLCENLPASCRVALSGRTLPRMPLARMALDGRTKRLSQSDLAFSRPEATMLFKSQGLSLSGSESDALYNASRGWPAITMALAQAAKGMGGRIDRILDFSANTLITDFVEEEVLAAIPPQTLRFLQLSSPLHYLSESDCRELLGPIDNELVADSRKHIRCLDRHQLVEHSIGRGYRCNPVLRKLLLTWLKSEDRISYLAIHKTLAALLVDRGLSGAAIPSALEGEEWSLAVQLLAENYSRLGMAAGFSELLGWLERIPFEYYTQSTELNIAKAMALIPTGRVEESEELLAKAEELLETEQAAGTRPENDFMVHCEIPIIRAYNNAFTIFRGEDLLRYAAEAEQQLGDNRNEAIRSSVALMDGIGNLFQGQYAKAEQCFQREMQARGIPEGFFVPLLAMYYLSMLEYQKGNIGEAEQLLNSVIETSRGDDFASEGLRGVFHILLAWVLYDQNRLNECREHALQGVASTSNWRAQTSLADGYEVLVCVHQALGEDEEADEVQRQRKKDANRSYPLFAHLSLNQTRTSSFIRVKGNPARNKKGMQRIWFLRQMAQSYINAAQWDKAERTLSSIADESREAELLAYVLEAQALRAVLLARQGDTQAADEAIAEALEIADAKGQTRLFLDEGEPMLEILRRARKTGICPAFASMLLRQAAQDAPERPEIALSPREQEVLSLLAKGCSPKQISEQIFVSIGTVRTHLHHIYEKLGVTGQNEAIIEAQRQGLA